MNFQIFLASQTGELDNLNLVLITYYKLERGSRKRATSWYAVNETPVKVASGILTVEPSVLIVKTFLIDNYHAG